MFEALFILTTIDTGTRIARFLLQEALGRVHPKFGQTDWVPGAVLSTALVTLGWGGLIWTGSIDTIWPMFGIANQLLAVIALCVVTTVTINAGRARYAILTLAPMLFVVASTLTAAYQMVTGRFTELVQKGMADGNQTMLVQGVLNTAFTLLIVAAVWFILASALIRWFTVLRAPSTAA
jgi:carbon starvation protein